MKLGLHLSDSTGDGGAQVHGSLLRVSKPGQLDLFAEKVIPAVEKF